MVLQDKIQKKADEYGKLAQVFLEGAKFALENQWTRVEDDLPCNHQELLNAKYVTKEVFVLKSRGFLDVDYMLNIDGKWEFFTNKSSIECWMPIPECTR